MTKPTSTPLPPILKPGRAIAALRFGLAIVALYLIVPRPVQAIGYEKEPVQLDLQGVGKDGNGIWGLRTSHRGNFAAQIVGSQLYAYSDLDRVLLRIDPKSGNALWRATIQPQKTIVSNRFYLNLAAVPGNKLLIVNDRQIVDAETGSILTTDTGMTKMVGGLLLQLTADERNRSGVRSDDEAVLSRDLTTGREVWRASLRVRSAEPLERKPYPLKAVQGGKLLGAGYSAVLLRPNGSEVWRLASNGDVWDFVGERDEGSEPVDGAFLLVRSGYTGAGPVRALVAVEAGTGKIRWEFPLVTFGKQEESSAAARSRKRLYLPLQMRRLKGGVIFFDGHQLLRLKRGEKTPKRLWPESGKRYWMSDFVVLPEGERVGSAVEQTSGISVVFGLNATGEKFWTHEEPGLSSFSAQKFRGSRIAIGYARFKDQFVGANRVDSGYVIVDARDGRVIESSSEAKGTSVDTAPFKDLDRMHGDYSVDPDEALPEPVERAPGEAAKLLTFGAGSSEPLDEDFDQPTNFRILGNAGDVQIRLGLYSGAWREAGTAKRSPEEASRLLSNPMTVAKALPQLQQHPESKSVALDAVVKAVNDGTMDGQSGTEALLRINTPEAMTKLEELARARPMFGERIRDDEMGGDWGQRLGFVTTEQRAKLFQIARSVIESGAGDMRAEAARYLLDAGQEPATAALPLYRSRLIADLAADGEVGASAFRALGLLGAYSAPGWPEMMQYAERHQAQLLQEPSEGLAGLAIVGRETQGAADAYLRLIDAAATNYLSQPAPSLNDKRAAIVRQLVLAHGNPLIRDKVVELLTTPKIGELVAIALMHRTMTTGFGRVAFRPIALTEAQTRRVFDTGGATEAQLAADTVSKMQNAPADLVEKAFQYFVYDKYDYDAFQNYLLRSLADVVINSPATVGPSIERVLRDGDPRAKLRLLTAIKMSQRGAIFREAIQPLVTAPELPVAEAARAIMQTP